VALPAHAQTSVCGGSISTTSVEEGGGSDVDIGVLFDCESCQIITGVWNSGVGVPDNIIMAIDVDRDDGLTFDIINSGVNWVWDEGDVQVPENGKDRLQYSGGTYSFVSSSIANDCQAEVTFRVVVTGSAPFFTITLSKVSIVVLDT
jgi:hypothetical protein